MKTILRRIFAAAAPLAALLATPLALATPTITINAPANASTVAIASTPAGITFTVTPLIGTSPVGTLVSSVNFLVNGTSIGIVGGGAFSTTYSTTWVPTAPGTYNLTAVVTDTSVVTSGTSPNLNTATSPLVIVTVSATRVVVLTAPATNTTLIQDSEIFLRATAALSDSIVGSVQFRLDGADLGAPVTQAPYSRAFVLSAASGFTAGSHTLVARTTSSDGTITLDSATANITVVAAVVGNAVPVVTMTSPASGASLPANQSVTVSATATDDGFIPSTTGGGVTFYVDGDLIGTDLVAPYSVTWTPTVAKTYSIRAQATDDKGSTVLSAVPYNVTVVAAVTAPTITFTPPTTVGVNTVTTLSAAATAGTGATITQVQFLSGATVLGTDTTAPYTFDWTPTATGVVSLTAKITDSNGTTATSSASSVTVAAAAPTVAITVPTNGTSVALGTTTALTATAVANGGAIVSRVDFLAGTTSIGTALTTPFTVNWTPTAAGITALTARVTDSNGVSITSVIANVNVTAPSVALTAPTAGSGATLGSPVALTATASAVGSATVTKVDFFAGATLVGTDTTAPYTFDWTPTAIGAVSLTARVTDSNTAVITSSAVSVTVATSVPTVALTSHANGASVALGTSPTLTATAAAFGGATVTRVDFLVGSTVVGSSLNAPYSTTWTPTASGVTALTARVTDSNGTTVTSATINVTVTAAPVVALTAPTAGAGVTLGVAVALTATASASGTATVSKVEFFAGVTLVGTALNAPYTVNWTPTATGSVSLTARVTDNNTATATSTAVNVTVATSVPTIALTSHANGASVALGTSPTLSATATAIGGATVTRVDFLVGSTVVGSSLTAPYSTTWTPTASGVTALTARVTDSNGTTVTSASVNVTVTVPSVALTAPTSGAGVTLGVAVALTATASSVAPATVTKVDFFAGATLVGTALTAPYTVNWTPTASGAVSLTARVTDSNTAATTSSAVNVTVATSVPTIVLTSHVNGASVALGTSPTLTATATAAAGATVARVDFLVGSTLVGSSLTAPFSTTWTPTASGVTALTARVTDSNGTAVTSAIANVIVTAPTVALSAPTSGAGVTLGAAFGVTASAIAFTPATVTKVDFFVGTTLVGTALTAPYMVNWTPTANGPASLTARVTDSNGAATTSTPVSVTVAASVPTVALTSHTNGVAIALGTATPLTATASALGGVTVTRVDFLVGTTIVGSSLTAPFSTTWTPTVAGVTTLTARVTDANGTTVTSSAITVVVTSTTLPSVALTAPATSASTVLGSPAPVTIAATASTTVVGATISRVDFYAGTTLIGTDATAPFTITWIPTAAGTVNLTARAFDSNSTSADSVAVPFIVNPAGSPTITLSVAGGGAVIPAGSARILTATVADDGAIDRVDFFLDGTLVGTDRVAPYNFLFTAPAEVGPHQLTARVTDNSGLTNTTAPIAIEIANVIGSPPTVAFVTPATGAFLPVGFNTTLTLNATDADGPVNFVQVFTNGTPIGNATLAAGVWSIVWAPPSVGAITLSAIATDEKGNAMASAPFVVNITDATSPTIVLNLTPATAAIPANTTIPAGSTRNILAAVTPASGRAVARVEFFVNGTKEAEKTVAPFYYRYTASATPGMQVVTVRATDNTGLARDIQQAFVVTSAVGTPPTANLLAPTTGAIVIPNSATPINLAAAALASSGTITSIQFYANGSPLAINGGFALTAAPYVASFNPTTTGSFVLDAIASDDRGNTKVSAPVTITAAFGTPTILVNAPTQNARATPLVPITFGASATAGTGAAVLLVEFLIDGEQVGTRSPAAGSLVPTFTTTFAWTPTAANLGARRLTVRVTDTNSFTATSGVVNLTVANVVGTPPILSGLTPGNGSLIRSFSTMNFVVNAQAGTGATISNVEFFLNGVSIGTGAREQQTNTFRRIFDFNSFDLSVLAADVNTGNYPVPLYAIARDSNGNQTIFPAPTSPALTLQVTPSTSAAPTVALITPGFGGPNTVVQNTQFLMLAQAADLDGTVTSLQLFVNGVATGGAIGNPQAQALVGYTPQSSGVFNLFVVATDDTGNTAVSTPNVQLNVTPLVAPRTNLVRPSDNSTITTVGAPIFLEATASGANITQTPSLQFIATGVAAAGQRTTINAQRLGTTTTYRAIWTPTSPDSYDITSIATVSGLQTTSTESRRVVVNNLVGLAPTVSFTVQGATTSASTINFVATATDPDGSVVSVEFFLNRNTIGQAVRDQTGNTWRLGTSLVGIPLGGNEIVAIARDSSGNSAASSTSSINIVAATSLAPTIPLIIASPSSVAFSRQVQLTANASDTDGTLSVQYFANGASIGSSSNAGSRYQLNWTPTASGTFNIYAVATDNQVNGLSNTAISPTIQVTVRRNNPIQDDTAFLLQVYADIANNSNVNPLLLADLADRIAAGTTTRTQVLTGLLGETGFLAPVNLLASYYVLMGQWPTPANYTNLLATARGSLANAIGQILSSNEYFLKHGIVPTTALLNNPTSLIPADTFINRLWAAAGLGSPSALQNLQFRSNNTASLTLGRGYNVGGVGINTALAEFITLTNSTNTALFNQARAAALYYQIDRPPTPPNVPANDITDAIAVRVAELVKLADDAARADAVLKDILYTYRYVTFLKHPQSLVVSPRSGAIFTVEALGAPPIIYQWLFNGTPIPNANGPILSLTNVDTTRVGTYTVVVTTTAGSATSDPATLTLSSTPSRVANISTRGVTAGGNQALIAGFVVANAPGAPPNQTRQMLIRVIGPSLNGPPLNLNVAGALNNPVVEVYNSAGVPILTNDNWGNQSGNAAASATQVTAIQQATTRVGTFALAPNSQDAVVFATLPAGNYTVQASGANPAASGVVLIEVYDATLAATTATSPRASNVATRGEVGTGANVLIAGFVINGTASRRMLLRGVGPTLTRFGLGQNAVLADPLLTLKDAAGVTLRTNDDWSTGGDAAVIAAAAVSGGAFALANGSKDAAMIIMLPPGAYTVQLSGVGNTTGIGIVEVYDIDP